MQDSNETPDIFFLYQLQTLLQKANNTSEGVYQTLFAKCKLVRKYVYHVSA